MELLVAMIGVGIILSLPALFFWQSFPEERKKVFSQIKSELVRDLNWIRAKFRILRNSISAHLHPSRELVRLSFEIRIQELQNEIDELRNDRDRPIDLKKIRQLMATKEELKNLLSKIEHGYSQTIL